MRPLSSSIFNAIWANGVVHPVSIIGVTCSHALEDRRVVRKRYFFNSLSSSMDCVGTRKKKHHPDRFLGVQCHRQSLGIKLLCYLSPRFGRGADDIGALAPVYEKPLLEMARGAGGAKGEKGYRRDRSSPRSRLDRLDV